MEKKNGQNIIRYKVSARQRWYPLYKHCICFTKIWLEFVSLHVYRVILEDRWSSRTVYQGGFSCLASPLGVMAVERGESPAFTHGSPPSLIGSWQRYRVSCSTCCTHYWNKEYLHHQGFKPSHTFCSVKSHEACKSHLHFILQIPESFGSREPTCPELLKTSDLSEEQQMSEFNTLCHYYTLSCSSTLDPSACQRLAQDKCQSRFKKCRKLSRHFNLKNVHILTTFAFNEVLVWMCIQIFYYY